MSTSRLLLKIVPRMPIKSSPTHPVGSDRNPGGTVNRKARWEKEGESDRGPWERYK